MSDYATPFANKLLDDEAFDTIFGGELDDQLMEAVMASTNECDCFDDQVSTNGIEDGIGGIGKGKGLGSDLGPGHDTTCCGMKPTDDSSDEDIIDSVDSYKQKHVIDTSKSDPTQKGADGIDPESIEDESEKLKKVNNFEDAYSNLLKEIAEEEEYMIQYSNDDYERVQNPNDYATDSFEDDEDEYDDVEDEELVSNLVGEEADVREDREFDSIDDDDKDSYNLGDDLGPDNDTTGGMKPKDDSSDEDIIAAVSGEHLKDGQLNVGDNAYGKIVDGSTVNPKDARVAGDDFDAADDDFKESSFTRDFHYLLDESESEEYKEDEDDEIDTDFEESFDFDIDSIFNEADSSDLEEDDKTTEAEEDYTLSVADDDEAPMKYSIDDLNSDEDDDIMSAVECSK